MLTTIGRAAAQRLLVLRAAPLTIPRTQPNVRAACRAFSTSQWARSPATKAPATKTKTKKPATRKAATGKPKAAKKQVVKKPAPKKELTPEQKLKIQKKEAKKVALLTEPKRLPQSPWHVYVTSEIKAINDVTAFGDKQKKLSDTFKTFSSYEIQRLQEKADENKRTNDAAYQAWVTSHTPQEIAEANRARARLRKIHGRLTPRDIQDDRQPSRPQGPYVLFTKARWASGDLNGTTAPTAASRLSQEWKALSEPEKSVYRELAKAEFDRYQREVFDVLGRTIQRRSATPE
ncbi:hypothetical protein CCHL11_01869 [Colletotrichum chlorophyti]|uniref:HMG box domain-containing protein n=1 Tax=Colletotrichum chlorophyti TaxID=708187 RepID=A0A1Q8RW59_9PEZI|nr:hypothetical protein CCHL11_01869 [Colletotrichum chlorophyti]